MNLVFILMASQGVAIFGSRTSLAKQIAKSIHDEKPNANDKEKYDNLHKWLLSTHRLKLSEVPANMWDDKFSVMMVLRIYYHNLDRLLRWDNAYASDGGVLKYASDNVKADKEIALWAVKEDWQNLADVSSDLASDKQIIRLCTTSKKSGARKRCAHLLDNASPVIRSDRELVMEMISSHYKPNKVMDFAAPSFRGDKEIVMRLMKNYGGGDVYDRISPKLQTDREIYAEAIKTLSYDYETNKSPLEFAAPAFKNDSEIVMESVRKNPYSLKFASPFLKNDSEIVKESVIRNPQTLEFASPALRQDKTFILKFTTKGNNLIKFAHPTLRADKQFLSKITQKINKLNEIKYQRWDESNSD